MPKRLALCIGFWLPLGAQGWVQAAKPVPPPPRSYVYNENVVSAAAADRLSQALAGAEQATGHQFVIALFQSLDGESLEDYSNRVFRTWRIGDAKRNDGLLFALFRQDRRWRVEVGYGLESVITDLDAGEIVRDSAVPYFRSGNYDAGIEAAVARLIGKLQGAPAQVGQAGQPQLGADMLLKILLLILAWALVISLGNRMSGRHYIRGGGYGGVYWPGGGGWGGGGWGSGGSGGFSGGGGLSGGGGASGGW